MRSQRCQPGERGSSIVRTLLPPSTSGALMAGRSFSMWSAALPAWPTDDLPSWSRMSLRRAAIHERSVRVLRVLVPGRVLRVLLADAPAVVREEKVLGEEGSTFAPASERDEGVWPAALCWECWDRRRRTMGASSKPAACCTPGGDPSPPEEVAALALSSAPGGLPTWRTDCCCIFWISLIVEASAARPDSVRSALACCCAWTLPSASVSAARVDSTRSMLARLAACVCCQTANEGGALESPLVEPLSSLSVAPSARGGEGFSPSRETFPSRRGWSRPIGATSFSPVSGMAPASIIRRPS
eukprot:scaffold114885_cov63-Phaeocystis_antarctica.AAC.2